MFSGLRKNSLFYILEKGETPTLRIGQVMSVSNENPKFQTNYVPGQYRPMETTVDVTVKVDDTEMNFQNLPSNGQIANDKNMVVSESRDAMSAEVDAMLRQSNAILESIDYNKRVVSACEVMLAQLNPQIAKDKEQSAKITALEGKVSGIEGKLDQVISILSKSSDK